MWLMTQSAKSSSPPTALAEAVPRGQPVVFDWIREAYRDLAMQSANVVYPTQGPCGGRLVCQSVGPLVCWAVRL